MLARSDPCPKLNTKVSRSFSPTYFEVRYKHYVVWVLYPFAVATYLERPSQVYTCRLWHRSP